MAAFTGIMFKTVWVPDDFHRVFSHWGMLFVEYGYSLEVKEVNDFHAYRVGGVIFSLVYACIVTD